MQITWTYALATPFDQMVKLAQTLHIHCRLERVRGRGRQARNEQRPSHVPTALDDTERDATSGRTLPFEL
jgi:hypothetical protein